MAQWVCKFGHTEPDPKHPGQLHPVTHSARNRCSIYVELRRTGKIDLWGRPIGGASLPSSSGESPSSTPPSGSASGSMAPAGPSSASPASPPAPAEPKKEPLLKKLAGGLGIRYHEATVAASGPNAPQPQLDENWEVSEATSVAFWKVLFGFVGTVCNLLCGWLEIPNVPKEVFEMDAGQEFAFKTALRGFTTNILKKVFRAKSPEDADRIVAGLSGLLGFGTMGMNIALHFLIHVPKSPRLAKWRQARAEAAAERKRRAGDRDAGPETGILRVPVRPAGAPG